MIHVDAMRDFVRYRRTAHQWWGEDQPPAVAKRAARRTTSPSRLGITDTDPGYDHARARGEFMAFGFEQRLRFRAQPSRDARGKLIARAATGQPFRDSARRARRLDTPRDL